jgi:transcriptional regulator with XRE-family HTH domain
MSNKKNTSKRSQKRNYMSVEMDKMIGARIKEYRRKTTYSHDALASRLDVHLMNIGKYEKGISQLNIGRFISICRVLEVSPLFLLQDFIDDACEIIQEKDLEGSKKYFAEIINAGRTERKHGDDREYTPKGQSNQSNNLDAFISALSIVVKKLKDISES